MATAVSESKPPAVTVSRASTAASTAFQHVPPFDEGDQLCKDLKWTHSKSSGLPCLQSQRAALRTLPDAPRVPLDGSRIMPYCLEDLDTPGMNALGEKLFWAGPSMTVKPLSEQLTIGRKFQVTEDPSLHCVWTDDIIFLKPLPAYLSSHAFWQFLVDPLNSDVIPDERTRLVATSLGFLRTYGNLIQRRSDFNVARRHELLSSFGNTTFEDFITFIMAFDSVPDSAVSMRWHFGELNLDALNFHSVLLLRKWHRNRFESRYSAYFQRFFPVVLFMFALFSVMLSAMQVILAAQPLRDTDNKGFKKTIGVFIWFGTESIGWSLAFGGLFVIWWLVIASGEAWQRHVRQNVWKKEHSKEAAPQP